MKKITIWVLIALQIFLLTACVKTPSASMKDSTEIADNIPSEILSDPSDITTDDPIPTTDETLIPVTLENSNVADILQQSAGVIFSETISGNGGTLIMQNTPVNVDGVENIGVYNYTILPLSDDFRESLFSAVLGDRQGTISGDASKNIWKIRLSDTIGDHFQYDSGFFNAGECVSGQDVFRFEYGYVNLYPFDDNILASVEQSPMSLTVDDAVTMCQEVLKECAGGIEYCVDSVVAYGTNGRTPYYKIFFKQSVDNMVITAYNDMYFYVDDNGIELVVGCLYDVGEEILGTDFISVGDAVKSLKENAALLTFDYFDENTLSVSAVTLEYVVVNSNDGSAYIRPAWRFIIGENDDQINIYRDRIVAIDAVTGELIQGRRGNTF